MSVQTATVLPRREDHGPADNPDRNGNAPVVAGYDSAGRESGALFLLAHSEFTRDFEWSLHPHERLEILTVALEGVMRHYDTATEGWFELHPGDVQMMRSGPGISHIENSPAGTRGFQIQFDPGAEVGAAQVPSYTDHRATEFTSHQVDDARVIELVGPGSPVESHTEGLHVSRIQATTGGRVEMTVGEDRYTIAYVIDGAPSLNGGVVERDDAVALDGAPTLTVQADAAVDVLMISVPVRPSYEVRRRPRADGDQRPAYLDRGSARA